MSRSVGLPGCAGQILLATFAEQRGHVFRYLSNGLIGAVCRGAQSADVAFGAVVQSGGRIGHWAATIMAVYSGVTDRDSYAGKETMIRGCPLGELR